MTNSNEGRQSELFHYTGIAGLEGIIRDRTLWATHANFLNDSMELKIFKERLQNLLHPKVKEIIENMAPNPANEGHIAKMGGIDSVINNDTGLILDALFNVLNGTRDNSPFFETYLTSFCTAETAEISDHGLLSQWRGYGQEGGYAIAFDSAKMSTLIDKERNSWPAMLFGGERVVYSWVTDEEILEKWNADITKIQDYCLRYLTSGALSSTDEDEHYVLARCACLYKHWGFHEENEFRIVATLPNESIFEELKRTCPESREKMRHHFLRKGTAVPCIHLFDEIEEPLPITRIIVGPHREQDRRCMAVKSLLKQHGLKDIEVSPSEIPYIGHHH
jgi:hypothetical protein